MRNSKGFGKMLLIVVAIIVIVTAIAHLSCIVLGPQCYSVQMAPEEIIQSAKDETLLAALGTLFISSLFFLIALFALSSARVIRRLPLLSVAVHIITALCIIRGLATIPSSFLFPEMVSTFSIIAGATWFLTGLMFFVGHKCVNE